VSRGASGNGGARGTGSGADHRNGVDTRSDADIPGDARTEPKGASGDGEGGGAAAGEDPDRPQGPALDVVQRWFQAVVTHPAGAAAGIASPAAQGFVPLGRGALERLVRRSSRLTAEQRLAIYANAYYARLLECLAECFPVLERALGAEVFAGFAFDYLQRYPSRSYTLDRLADSFPRFLEETRPDRPQASPPLARDPAGPDASSAPPGDPTGPGGSPTPAGDPTSGSPAGPGASPAPAAWPDFLIDLATLELAIAKVFDGPGAEGEPLLAPADLVTLSAGGRFAVARLTPVPCLRLLRFRYPVNAFYGAARISQDQPPFPDAAEEHVALSRTDFVVRRYALNPLEHAILSALLAGASVGEAIAAAAAASQLSDGDLAPRLEAAFRRWTAAGFFRAAVAGGAAGPAPAS
jgi:hypothetical protein